ncbi:topoisomerase II-associated protein [Cristinia sonorae]|uniref:Topoisomerase II-associated protein n=1 Tax=Cristinia sonorae TaxID=1940300 RepID=A0A8K0XSQ3_9AGAR|nr:topoisomerase II-associated protein [Cristinia sonorae]
MSFFGFDQPNDLEDQKRRFLEGGLAGAKQEDVAVFTWGEDSYDGLGDALQEGGDELNDETFGGSGAVGKDFDFSNPNLPEDKRAAAQVPPSGSSSSGVPGGRPSDAEIQRQQPNRGPHSLESLWDDKSPFSVLPKSNGVHRAAAQQAAAHHSPAQQYAQPHQQGVNPSYSFSPFDQQPITASSSRDPAVLTIGHGGLQQGAPRTLEEVEAEMREAFAARRNQNISPSQSQSLAYAQTQAQAHARSSSQRIISPSNTGTPPPRMHPRAQSPRFHQQQSQRQIDLSQQQQQYYLQQQQQLLELQEQRKRTQQLQLLELQEQLRLEELERQRQIRLQHYQAQAQAQAQAQEAAALNQLIQRERLIAEKKQRLVAMAELQQRRFGSPSSHMANQQHEVPFQQSMPYLPREIQQQQRMLAEMAQAEFLRSYQGTPNPMPPGEDYFDDRHNADGIRAEAMRKIQEAERMEEARKRKLNKIRYMARYNDLMTQSDKDFITRIQVSQLVSQDPYADDFYAQVYGAVMRSRMGVSGPDAVLKFGSGGGVGLGVAQVKGGRRPSAMQRMEQQVERIVNNARMREKEKTSLNSLQGALGRTAGRSYKAAPRQLLQVDSSGNGDSPTLSNPSVHPHISKTPDSPHAERAGVAAEAAKLGRQALASGNTVRDPLSHREALVIIERVYDHILNLEHLRREQPEEGEEEALVEWQAHHDTIIAQIWNNLQVNLPLDTSTPHPFLSLLLPIKGKRMLPRVTRHFDSDKGLTLLTLLVACFSQLDVVMNSPLLDTLDDTLERKELDSQTQAFLGSVMQSVMPTGAAAGLKVVSGMLGVFLERNDIGFVARTRPGIALLTMFLSRVEVIKQSMSSQADASELPTEEDMTQWQYMFDHLFQLLTPHLIFLFPSVRQSIATGVPYPDIPSLDTIDQPVWQFLAALALNAGLEQQQVLVASLRERVLENVSTATKGWLADEEIRKTRLANVNIFLHALGLDSSQIAL